MPLDATGAWVPDIVPPTPEQLGVAPAPARAGPPNLPLNPLAIDWSGILDPNSPASRPLVVSPTQGIPEFGPQTLPAPAQNLPVAVPAPNSPTPVNAGSPQSAVPVVGNRGAAGGGGTGLPAGSADLQKEIKAGTEEERAAAGNLGDVQQQGAADLGQAYEDRENLRRQQVTDLAAEQLYVRERKQALDAEDAQNLQTARDKTIPGFWDSHEGMLAGAAVTVGLSGAAAALTGSSHNVALEAIQHNVDSYYQRESDKIQNLFKYAQEKGHLNDEVRAGLQGQVTDLMQQHALTLASAADRIEQVTAQSQGRVDAAKAQQMAAQLRAKSAAEMGQARDLDLKIYDSKTKRMEANAAVTRAAAEKTRANAEGSEKADEAAFRTYVQAPHGKQAQETTRRVEALRSASEGIDQAKSVGEVTAQIDKAIAADAGQGTRGVSMGQLHTILPNLVSASGEISNKVSQNWDGSAGKDFRAAAKRLVDTARQGREGQYQREATDLEKNLGLTPHAKKNPDFAKSSRMQLYPDLPASAPVTEQNSWRPIPRNMAGAPALKGKTQVLVDGSGNVVDAR